MVDAATGALTTTCSPQFEKATFSLPPPEAVEVSWIGSVAPIAERVSVVAQAGSELVAAVFHFRMYNFWAEGWWRWTAPCPWPRGAHSPLKKLSSKPPGLCTGSSRL